jgi:tetratricopeptide (TPR) repeat protein
MLGWRSPALPLLALLALTMATYSDSFSGIIEGDAAALVSTDSRVHSATLENLRLIAMRTYWSSITSSSVYRPLVTLSWMLNYVGFSNKDRALGYHVVNLALHMINVILAWLVIRRIWGDPLPAFLTAAVFAVHPVNAEAVTNIAGRADLMAGTGILSGLLLHIYLPDWTGWRRKAAIGGLALASCFGLLSKEHAVILPAAMLLYDILFRSRIQTGSYLAVLTPILAILAWRHWVLPGILDDIVVVDNPLAAAPFWKGRLTALEVLWRYLGLLVWPRQLSWDYSYHQIPLATTGGGLIALTGLLALVGFLGSLYRRAVAVCFFGIFFFLAIGPTSNLLFLVGSILAERFLYLPSIGFAVCIVAAVAAIWRRLAPSHAVAITAAVIAVALAGLGARTWVRNGEWTDGKKLWDSALTVSPNSFKTHLARINSLYRRGLDLFSLDECIEEAQKAAAIVADLPPEQSTALPLATLGSLYQLKGDTLTAQQNALLSVTNPSITGTFESPQQWYDRALDAFAQAVALDDLQRESERRRALARGVPKERIRFGGSSFLYSHLADTYRRLGRFKEALQAFRHLSAIAPIDAAVYEQIAQVQGAMGSSEDAIVTLWQAVSLRPSEADQADLVNAYLKLNAGGCAILSGKPNMGCPLVRAHRCRRKWNLRRGWPSPDFQKSRSNCATLPKHWAAAREIGTAPQSRASLSFFLRASRPMPSSAPLIQPTVTGSGTVPSGIWVSP